MEHFADRLVAAIRQKQTPLCVGLDPRWEALPLEVRQRHADGTLAAVGRAFEEFCARVIDVVAPLVPVVKPQSAFFEACGPAGWQALQRLLGRARRQGLLSILDSKRNDIASTAAAYADAALGGVKIGERWQPVWDADALTVNPYLGRDAVEPFIASARRSGRGVFVLVRTSNPGAGQFQDLVADGRPVFQHVAEAVRAWTRENLGRSGYGDVGAVVGATHPKELAEVRQVAPEAFFLVPGYGAQGGSAADTAAAFAASGLGGIVNSSRAILFSGSADNPRWEDDVAGAARQAIVELNQVVSRISQER